MYASLGLQRAALHLDLFEQFCMGGLAHPRLRENGTFCHFPSSEPDRLPVIPDG
jgi:hypothetical protein